MQKIKKYLKKISHYFYLKESFLYYYKEAWLYFFDFISIAALAVLLSPNNFTENFLEYFAMLIFYLFVSFSILYLIFATIKFKNDIKNIYTRCFFKLLIFGFSVYIGFYLFIFVVFALGCVLIECF